MFEEVVEESNRYCLSRNDLAIIKGNTDKPISENARKTLTILSEVFGGLHHLDSDQLELFDYQTDRYNQYLISGGLATFDFNQLTSLVIMAHDMAVRLNIDAKILGVDDDWEDKLLHKQAEETASDYDMPIDEVIQQMINEPRPYLRLQFHQREGREGRYFERHPTLEDAMKNWRSNK